MVSEPSAKLHVGYVGLLKLLREGTRGNLPDATIRKVIKGGKHCMSPP